MPESKRNFREQQFAFARHLRDPQRFPAPEDVEDRRLQVYRDLFFNNIQSLLAGTFPVLYRILGAERWAVLIRDFYREHVSHTPLFMEVPQEFLAWLCEEFENNGAWPDFMPELAHYEWLELAVSIDVREIDAADVDPGGNVFDAVPVLSPVARLAAYRYPVHRIGPDHQPDGPDGHTTFLVVYRKRDDCVGFMEINPVTARLFELLADNSEQNGRALLQRLAQELQHPDPAVVIESGRAILEDLQHNDIIAGTRG